MSLPEDDVAYLDAYARNQGFDSRSAALQEAVRMLRQSELVDAYAEAFRDYDPDNDLWDQATGDGIE